MAASRLLRAVAAFVILLSFAARLRKSYWSGCMKAATLICQQIFSILALVIFLLKILLKSASKSSCTTTVRGWTTKSRTTKFSADNTVISGKLCGPFSQSLLMLRWSADKVLPQRFQLSFDGRGLGVRCYEPHPGVNGCASVASPFIGPCEPQNASVTCFWFMCALLRTAQTTMIVLHTCEKTKLSWERVNARSHRDPLNALCSMGWSFVVCWMYDFLDHFFFRHQTQSSMIFSILALVFFCCT